MISTCSAILSYDHNPELRNSTTMDSPSSSQGSFHEPNLGQLVEYLLDSKRSLSSISLIWRAREIVDTGREALEHNATLCARNVFVRSTLDKQIDSLEAIRYGATIVDAEGYDEFQVYRFILHVMEQHHLTCTGNSTIPRRRLRPPTEDACFSPQHARRTCLPP